jgi:hypothetical protein
MLKLKLLVLVAIAVAIAAVGAGWKWHFNRVPAASTSYRIAGWTWGDGGVSNEQQSHTNPGAESSRHHS